MAPLVKIKSFIFLVSLLVIVLIQLLDANFYRKVTIKEWKDSDHLSWEDFKGISPPFSSHAAAISSTVYIKYDSALTRYIAFAGQDNMRSWVKEKTDYGLEHEWYHFKITEFYARKMNHYIAGNPNDIEDALSMHLNSIRKELYTMQKLYDSETKHSVVTNQQYFWEFKIDSLLSTFDQESDMTFDPYGDIEMKFFNSPVFYSDTTKIGASRSFADAKYNVMFSVLINQFNIDLISFDEGVKKMYDVDSINVVKFKPEINGDEERYCVKYNDSISGETIDDIWIKDNAHDYIYKIEMRSPFSCENDSYDKIKQHFYRHFKFKDQNHYWLNFIHQKKGTETTAYTEGNFNEIDSVGTICFNYSPPGNYLFFKKPFKDKDGNLIIIFDPLAHAQKDISFNMASIKGRTFTSKPDSVDQIFIIPQNEVPEGDFYVFFGYLVKDDLQFKCYTFYYQSYYFRHDLE